MKFCSLIFFLSLLIVIPNTGHAAEFAVTKTTDTADGNCNDDCSLREAIIAANANGEADVITVPAGVYPLGLGTTGEDAAAEGDLDITEDVTLNGAGVGATVIDGMKRDRVFEVDPGVAGITANINGLTIQNGSDLDDSDGGSGIVNWGILNLTNVHVVDNFGPSEGGGIYNQSGATLSLENVEVLRNVAVDGSSGGGIYNDGVANLNNSKVNHNVAGSNGGGVYSSGSGGTELNISKSEVNDNFADDDGGGIYISSDTAMVSQTNILRNSTLEGGGGVRLSGSTVHAFETTVIADNFAGDTGGGIYQQGSATLGSTYVDVEISGNFDADGNGGGVHLSVGSMSFNRAQISDNETLGHGGGIYANGSDSIDLDLTNTTISQNIAGGSGGGIHHARGSLLTTNSTIVHNLADADDTGGEKGGGFFEDGTTAGSEFSNTILALNMDLSGVAPDCSGTITSDGGNLIQDTSDCTGAPDFNADITGEDPMIGVLAMNGGPTQTHHLLPGSMAIDNAVDANCPNVDQRGRTRDDGDCDIGAVEDGVCGDGFIDGGEECDDGNNTDGDGCTSTCLVEAGFDCVGAPSLCSAVCGDGQVVGGEECDDGNLVDGDGCSALCITEPQAAQENGNGGCNLNAASTGGANLGWMGFLLLMSLGFLRRRIRQR